MDNLTVQSRTGLFRSLSPRPTFHSWTNDELNILAYHRSRHRKFVQIQKACFPSLSIGAISRAYARLSIEERARRASIAVNQITTSTDNLRNKDPAQPRLALRPTQSYHSTSGIEDNAEASSPSPSERRDGSRVAISANHTASRYHLRLNRPKTFRKKGRCLLVDRLRFPHFFKSYKSYRKRKTASDTDYVPPPRSPTPDPSDRSPSVVSSVLSDASSLELFGLEARSPPP
jgi:hypothetical protein